MNLFRQSWIYTDDNRTVVCQWLSASSAQLAAEERTNHLGFLVDCLAKGWLQGYKVNPAEKLFIVIKAYQDMIKALETNGNPPKATDYEASDLAHNSPEKILAVARHFNFVEDRTWNVRVSRVLREAGHYEAAILCCQKAVEVAGAKDDIYHPYANLAITYARLERYSEAIDAAEKSRNFAMQASGIPEAEKIELQSLWSTGVLEWHAKLKDTKSVIKLSKEIMRSSPEKYDIATCYISTLCKEKQYTVAMEEFRRASSEMLEEKGVTRLTDWCIEMMSWQHQHGEFYDALAQTCRGVGDIDFAKSTYIDTMRAVKKTDSYTAFLLQAEYGKLLLREAKKPKQAAQILEKILGEVKSSRKDSRSHLALVVVVELLCEIYLARALHGGRDSKEALVNMEKLDKVWTRQIKSNSTSSAEDTQEDLLKGNVFLTTRNSTLHLASLYRAFGQPEKARPLLAGHLKLGLDLLIDEDPDNDWLGYFKIGDVLSRAKDDTGALAAYALVIPKWLPEEPDAVPDTSGSGSHLPIGSAPRYICGCDGDCGERAEYGVEDFYCCTFCVDKAFCKDCYKLLMEDKLGFKICGKDHEFLFVPVVKPFKKGCVPVGGDVMDQQEWLAKVRAEWGL